MSQDYVIDYIMDDGKRLYRIKPHPFRTVRMLMKGISGMQSEYETGEQGDEAL